MATHQLWPLLPPALANDILLSVQKTNKKLYRTAVEVMAPRMGVRVPILLETPKAQRHAAWVRLLGRPELEMLSFNIFSAWLIDTQRPMLCAWLDSLGIAHGANGCADHFPETPTPEQLKKGVDALVASYDPTLVSVYLRCFNAIDETHWPALEEILRNDPRLALKAAAAPAAQAQTAPAQA